MTDQRSLPSRRYRLKRARMTRLAHCGTSLRISRLWWAAVRSVARPALPPPKFHQWHQIANELHHWQAEGMDLREVGLQSGSRRVFGGRGLALCAAPLTWLRRVSRSLGRTMIQGLGVEFSSRVPGTARVVLHAPRGHDPCEALFEIVAGQLSAVSLGLGMRASLVQVTSADCGAVVDLKLPPSGTLWARLRRAAETWSDSRRVAARLAAQEADLLASRREIESLGQCLANVADEERLRLAFALHDGLGQTLTGLKLQAAAISLSADDVPPALKEVATNLSKLAQAASQQARAMSKALDPATPEQVNLRSGLEMLSHEISLAHELEVKCELAAECHLPQEVQEAWFRICQEALHNVAKHANSRTAAITLLSTPERSILTVEDAGCGLSPGLHRGSGMGLRIMRFRAERAESHFSIESAGGKGTKIICEWPATSKSLS